MNYHEHSDLISNKIKQKRGLERTRMAHNVNGSKNTFES